VIQLKRAYDPPEPDDGFRVLVDRLMAHARHGTVTLVYGAKDQEHNDAVALKEFLESDGVKCP
jgi:uncharacterized protein YeaO (DUF488 family)